MSLLGNFELVGFDDNISINTSWGGANGSYDPIEVLDICCEKFLQESKAVCPVDTGTLLNSISAKADRDGILAMADTDYAQYVEYGTWKMAAQPYFESQFNDMCEMAAQLCAQTYISTVFRVFTHTIRAIYEEHAALLEEAYEEYRTEIEMILGSPGSSEEKGAAMGAAWAAYKARRQQLAMQRRSCEASAYSQFQNYISGISFNLGVEF